MASKDPHWIVQPSILMQLQMRYFVELLLGEVVVVP